MMMINKLDNELMWRRMISLMTMTRSFFNANDNKVEEYHNKQVENSEAADSSHRVYSNIISQSRKTSTDLILKTFQPSLQAEYAVVDLFISYRYCRSLMNIQPR